MISLVLALINYLKNQNIALNGNTVKVSASFPVKEAEIPCVVVAPGEGTFKEISLDGNRVLVRETADVNVYAKSHGDRDSLVEQVENVLVNPSALENDGFFYMHVTVKRTLDLPEHGVFRTVLVVEAFRFILK